MKSKFLEQRDRGETILFTDLLKEIPGNDILLELFPDQDRPGHQLLTQRDLEILKLRLAKVTQKDIAEQLGITLGLVGRCIRKVKRFIAHDIPPYISVNIPLLNPRHYAEDLSVLSKRQQDVWTLYALGESRRHIAEKLNITTNAVTQHLNHAARRFREHDQYCAVLERNQESVDLPLTRGEVKVIIKALATYKKELERDHIHTVGSDFWGRLPWETQLVAGLYEKAQTSIYGTPLIKMLPSMDFKE